MLCVKYPYTAVHHGPRLAAIQGGGGEGAKRFKGKHELTGEFPKGCVEQGDQTKTPKMGGVYGYYLQPHISPL